jgi:hypothetical protein
MGRYGVDYDGVRQAAENLIEDGQPVTVERVRHLIGKGSLTTLGRHLRLWRRHNEPQSAGTDALPELINEAAQHVWANLNRAADERILQAQMAAQTEVRTAQTDAEAARAAMATEQEEAQRVHAQAMAHAQERYQNLTAQWQALEERFAASESARQALLEENGVLRGRVEQMVRQCELAQEEGQALRQVFTQAIAERDEHTRTQANHHAQMLVAQAKLHQGEKTTWEDQRQSEKVALAASQALVEEVRKQWAEDSVRHHAVIQHDDRLKTLTATVAAQGQTLIDHQAGVLAQSTQANQATQKVYAGLQKLLNDPSRDAQLTQCTTTMTNVEKAVQMLVQQIHGLRQSQASS